MSCILNSFGADIFGISDGRINSLIYNRKIANYRKEYFFDLKEKKNVKKIIKRIKPDIIFHLAAQSLVFKSYLNPSKTWQSNLLSSLNILEASRDLKKKLYS